MSSGFCGNTTVVTAAVELKRIELLGPGRRRCSRVRQTFTPTRRVTAKTTTTTTATRTTVLAMTRRREMRQRSLILMQGSHKYLSAGTIIFEVITGITHMCLGTNGLKLN